MLVGPSTVGLNWKQYGDIHSPKYVHATDASRGGSQDSPPNEEVQIMAITEARCKVICCT